MAGGRSARCSRSRQHISFTRQFSITSRRTRQRTAAVTASCRPARPALPPWPAPPSGNRHGRRPPARGRWQALPPPCRQRRHCRESEEDSWQSRFTAHNASHAKSLHCNATVPPLPSPALTCPAQQLTLGLLLLLLPPLPPPQVPSSAPCACCWPTGCRRPGGWPCCRPTRHTAPRNQAPQRSTAAGWLHAAAWGQQGGQEAADDKTLEIRLSVCTGPPCPQRPTAAATQPVHPATRPSQPKPANLSSQPEPPT